MGSRRRSSDISVVGIKRPSQPCQTQVITAHAEGSLFSQLLPKTCSHRSRQASRSGRGPFRAAGGSSQSPLNNMSSIPSSGM